MEGGIRQILGKTISGIVVAQGEKDPKSSLFLTFTDGTYFEMWGEHFNCSSELDRGSVEDVKKCVESRGAAVERTVMLRDREHPVEKSKKRLKASDVGVRLHEEMCEDILTPVFQNLLRKKGVLPKDPWKK